jgi:hypothetical protein
MIDSFNDLTYGNIYTFTLTYAPNSTMSAKVLRLSRTEDDI